MYFPGVGLPPQTLARYVGEAHEAFNEEHSCFNRLILYVAKAHSLLAAATRERRVEILEKLQEYAEDARYHIRQRQERRAALLERYRQSRAYYEACLPTPLDAPVPHSRVVHLILSYYSRTSPSVDTTALAAACGLAFLGPEDRSENDLHALLGQLDRNKAKRAILWCERHLAKDRRGASDGVVRLLLELLIAKTLSRYYVDVVSPTETADVPLQAPDVGTLLALNRRIKGVVDTAKTRTQLGPATVALVERFLHVVAAACLAQHSGTNTFGRVDVPPVASYRDEFEDLFITVEEDNEVRLEDLLLCGVLALRTRLCSGGRVCACPVCCLHDELAKSLPAVQYEISRIVDPVTGAASTQDNCPRCLPNGSVYLQDTLSAYSRNGLFTDVLDADKVFPVAEARKLYFV